MGFVVSLLTLLELATYCRLLTIRVMLIIFVLFGAATFLQAGARTPHPRVSREGLKGMKVDDVPELSKIKPVFPNLQPGLQAIPALSPPLPFLLPPQDFKEWLLGKKVDDVPELLKIKRLYPNLRVFPNLQPELQAALPFLLSPQQFRGFFKGISKKERTYLKKFLTKELGYMKCPRPHILDPDHLHSGACEDLNAKLDILEISTEMDVVPELPEIITVEPEIITIKPEYGRGLLPPPCSERVPPPRIFRKMLKDMSKEEKVKEKEDLIKDLTQCNNFRCGRPDIHNPDNWHYSTLCKDLKINLDILEEKL